METKDAELMRQTTMENTQIWWRYSEESPLRFNMRFIKEDLLTMNTLPNVKEVALDYKINESNGIAIAWVPYEF